MKERQRRFPVIEGGEIVAANTSELMKWEQTLIERGLKLRKVVIIKKS
jgi:hypothetical protein